MQQNTIIQIFLLLTSILVARLSPRAVAIPAGIVTYILLLVTLEYLYYEWHIRIKSDREALANAYDWFDTTSHQDNFRTDQGDLSEGIYDGHWEWPAERAMQNKYETYYRYLNLEPGKKLLDLGSGYCHWTRFCQDKGVLVEGVTLSEPQAQVCKEYKIHAHLQDFRIFVAEAEGEQYDAITAIGTMEHLASCGMSKHDQSRVFNEFFRNMNRLLKREGRALLTLCNLNPDYPDWQIYPNRESKTAVYTFKDRLHMYNLATFYGCGRYPHMEDCREYMESNFELLKVRNITEDYRWAGIRFGDHHWQNSRIYLNTPHRISKFCQYLVTDPYLLGRLNYSLMGSWYWQFGGSGKQPILQNDRSPIIVNCYVVSKRHHSSPPHEDPEALHLIH